MRLLERNHDGKFSLSEDFVGDNIPEYAILSHTWGMDIEEVTFQDLMNGTGGDKPGYKKICFCGEQARRDGLNYFWVDTCCIDKSNSTELSEAINSMFRWYLNAAKCYVYLSDVSTNDHDQVDPSLQLWQSAFQESRWFTRGWTLQELIAPPSVEFFCSNGKRLGDKKSLERRLHEITGIAIPALQGTTLSAFSVNERMSWAEHRDTKREEDNVYSLLGIFDIHLPLIYGEGAENAFRRLKEELYQRSRKHQLDELSNISHTVNPAKRLKALRCQQSSVPSSQDSEYSVHSNNPPETRKEPVTRASHNIDTTTKQSLIDQLYFTKIDERLTSLTAAQGTTCRWFLSKSEYKSWHDLAQQPVHGGFLWIKGNPGTGKSTLMKLLFEQAKLNSKGDSSHITLSFFFLARGTFEEKSTTGLYRSLLHQLFEKVVELRDSLEWMTADGARVIQRNGWSEEALKQTLTHAVQKLGSWSLTIFIDALDECDKNQVADMICFFEELCDCAREAQAQLQICFSSRHYPTVVIQKGIEVTLEDEIGHMEDIKQYIKSKFRLGKSKQAESLRSEILEKSSSIFLWVVLVLDILNSEYPDSSISIKKIRGRLKEIPPKLTGLFEMILTRDGENLERMQICLKWILFATRPLKPQELYFAIQLGLDKDCSTYWDQEDVELDQIKTFVRSSSKGLAEVTRNKASEVQFIHESVRDFLMGKYERQWSGASRNFVGHSHEVLRNCCLAQLNASINGDVNIPDPLPHASKAADLRETIRLKFPFLQYSILNVLRHANSAQQYAMEQGDFLSGFPLQRWIFLNNTLERYNIRRYTKSVSTLYILAENNLADFIRIHPQRQYCFEVEDERYGLPIFAALATGSQEAVQAFLEAQVEFQQHELLLHHLCKQYSENTKEHTCFSRDFTFSRHKGILSHIAEQGDEVILTFFCASGKPDVEERDKRYSRTPLSWAAASGNGGMVKLLLEKGAELEAKDSDGWTPLSWAVRLAKERMVKLLLEKGAELEAKDKLGLTPLSWAATLEHERIVELLLEKGAELEAKDSNGLTPLSWAVGNGHERIVKLLLEKGAELEAKDSNGLTPLLRAARNSHERMVELLLEKGVELEAKDITGQSPLLWAARSGYERMVELLLEKGAELEAKDSNGLTPLSWAVGNGHERIVKLLLEKGAELEAKDSNGLTPLLRAARNSHERMVELLLEKGAELEAKNINGQSPLIQAVENGHERIVELLLEKGAELEAKDNNGQTPLFRAVGNRHELMVELLLEKGAELEAKDSNGQTPLFQAVENGHGRMVELLLEKGAELEAKDINGLTPLSWAARSGYERVVELLLAKDDVDVNSKDKDGRTPLSWAAQKWPIIQPVELLRMSSEPPQDYQVQLMLLQQQNKKRLTLARQEQEGTAYEEVVKLLLAKNGIEVNSKDNDNRTPLSWAVQGGHKAIVNLLLAEDNIELGSEVKDGWNLLS